LDFTNCAASNKQLLRLFEAAQFVKSKFGSRQALAEAVASAMGKAKDKDYVGRIAKYTAPRLVAMYHAATGKKGAPAAAAH
jgi:hypothetical protein